MGESHDFITLDWVQTDIEETLLKAQEHLEAYLSNVADKGPLDDCYDAVYQVHGSLQMVGVTGAMLLTEQMQLLLNAMREDSLQEKNDAPAALVQALVILQPYLERLKSSAVETPVLLLSTINEIQRVLGVSPLSELSLFEPVIHKPAAASEAVKSAFDQDVLAEIKKLRQVFQFALTGLIRKEAIKLNVARMSNAFARLQKLCKGAPINQLFEVASAYQEGLLNETIAFESSSLNTLRDIDKEIKKLILSGVAGLDHHANASTMKNMLYAVAKSVANTPHIQAVKQEFDLLSYQLSSPESHGGSLVAGPDKETLNSVVVALHEELEKIKDTIDLYVRSENKANIDLGGLQPGLQQITNTLLVLNLEAPRLVAQEQLDTLLGYSNGDSEIPGDALLQIAESLLYVEAELDSILDRVNSNKGENDQGSITDTVLTECLESLKQSKEAMAEYFSNDFDTTRLEKVPPILHGVYGGLTMLSYSNAAQLIFAIAKYLEDDVLAMEKIPEQNTIEMMAEVVSAVEYYIEGIVSGKSVGDAILEPAKKLVASLGYPIEQTEGIFSEQTDELDSGSDFLGEPLEFVIEDDLDLELVNTDSSHVEDENEAQEASEQPNLSLDESDSVEVSANILSFEKPEEVSGEDSDNQDLALDTVDFTEEAGDQDSLIDDEILEIFVEEAEEVFESIDAQWPQFVNDNSNQDALMDVRRAFHTLKGSGRMVGAEVLGNLSWSVENLLNQLLEGAITHKPAFNVLVDDVRDVLPSLLVQFSHGTDAAIDVDGLIERAEILSQGGDLASEVEVLPEQDVQNIEETASAEQSDSLEEIDFDIKTELLEDAESLEKSDGFDEISSVEEAGILEEEPEEIESLDSFEVELVEDIDTTVNMDSEFQDDVADRESDESNLEIEKIFLKEAAEHLATMDEFVAQVGQSVEPTLLSAPLYRALHTLSGGAQMASLDAVAEVATAGEHLVNDLRAYEIPADQELLDIIAEASALMKAGLVKLENGSDQSIDGVAEFLQRVQELSFDRLATVRNVPGQAVVGQVEYAAMETSPFQTFLIANIDRICSVNDLFEDWSSEGAEDPTVVAQLRVDIEALQIAAYEVDIPALTDLLMAINEVYAFLLVRPELSSSCLDVLADGHESLVSTMDECAAGLDATMKTDVIVALKNIITFAPEIEASEIEASEIEASEIEASEIEAPEIFADVEASEPEAFVAQDYDEPVESEFDSELLDIFLEEAEEIAEVTANAKQRWIENNEDLAAVDELQRGLHTLKGSSRMAGITTIGDLSHELESVYEHINAGQIEASAELFDLLHACDDCLADMLSNLKQGQGLTRPNALILQAQEFLAEQLGRPKPDASESQSITQVYSVDSGSEHEAEDDILEAFLVTAKTAQVQLANAVSESIHEESDKSALYAQIQTIVADLKESAYQAGAHELGDLLQFFVEVIANIDAEELDTEEVQTDLSDWLERIETIYGEISESVKGGLATDQTAGIEIDLSPAKIAESKEAAAQNNIRVPSSLLEQLVNLAGETSVSRARIEQQVSNFGYSLEEVGSTVERLREQLRRLELETEAQILFRAEREGPTHEGFDPLEMDRYSRIQELSRALVETVSDMFDLKDTLRDRLRYTDNLLLQQSRVNTELQIGLMKTRMVPFSRMVPRLQRIVRLVSRELGKSVEFKIKNADAEMDRSLLENMIAPLEHMLRNAVDHGVETSDVRKKEGKSAKGNIKLSISRDGGDIVLELKDDGAGINIESVRAKAIERGLMAENAELTDHEVLQFILQAGFSTAAKVTQISGRGVGMDVVQSEIKKMGGSIKIDSELGQGTHFTVRLPFTVSVNRALLVAIGDESFALPLSTIEGVVRVSPYELEEYYKEDGPDFEYAGETYDLHYLGDYVGHKQEFSLQNQALPLPVILIRSGDQTTAVQVDSITGSREVVVKPLGAQLNTIPGMSGATILGDGQVVLILDLAAMLRAKSAIQFQPDDTAAETQEHLSDQIRVMVVDDSVTVRKVASRLLQRHGMLVTVAKDGVEAMTKLQDFIPSIILLDIEMPRMDGFELASLVRRDERLQDVPIVMISSRTGHKHQERALEIGVNSFMGKPFQEEGLLDAITKFTTFERAKAE